ncbi:hypothetical protein F8B43_5678 [Methylorubrum populi]|uniref:Uncharacterized protein n=1 Tax=Methylorubrum populi TaxID=223967 RepID=A0A833IZR6_9HYPH|nr:hypothetical protein F8B43_5678 [Methylorubrum populi]
MRALNDQEIAVLRALSDEFMSASVIKIRAGRPSSALIDEIRDICIELERRGLAEHTGSARRSRSRWRRSTAEVSICSGEQS